MAAYPLIGIDTPLPPVTRNDESIHAPLDALAKAFR